VNVVDEVIGRWRDASVGLRPGATTDQIAVLETLLSAPIPADVREYFSKANGMVDGEIDEYSANFWPLDKIVNRPFEIFTRGLLHRSRNIAFADVLIDSWFICFRVTRGRPLSIWVQGAGLRGMELPTLSDFFALYLSNPRRLCL
jgi:hypothetical protein